MQARLLRQQEHDADLQEHLMGEADETRVSVLCQISSNDLLAFPCLVHLEQYLNKEKALLTGALTRDSSKACFAQLLMVPAKQESTLAGANECAQHRTCCFACKATGQTQIYLHSRAGNYVCQLMVLDMVVRARQASANASSMQS